MVLAVPTYAMYPFLPQAGLVLLVRMMQLHTSFWALYVVSYGWSKRVLFTIHHPFNTFAYTVAITSRARFFLLLK